MFTRRQALMGAAAAAMLAAMPPLSAAATEAEIANLPLDVALDLDIYPGDADRIAHDAVYGKAA